MKFSFHNTGCKLVVGKGVRISGLINFRAPNSIIEIGDRSKFKGEMQIGLEARISIGTDLTVVRGCFISAAEKQTVTIGNDCMFASHIQLRSDDAHAIYHKHTGQRINVSKPVTIGNKVWLGYEVVVLGGRHVGNGSVIGLRSWSNRKFPDPALRSVVPAKVVRHDITWERPHLNLHAPHFYPDRMPASGQQMEQEN